MGKALGPFYLTSSSRSWISVLPWRVSAVDDQAFELSICQLGLVILGWTGVNMEILLSPG